MLHRAARYSTLLVALLVSSSVSAQSLEDLLKGSDGLLAPPASQEGDPEVGVTLQPIAGEKQNLLLSVRVQLPEGAYTYSQNPSFLGHSAIDVSRLEGVEAIDTGFLPDHPPKKAYDEIFEQDIEKFTEEVTWYRRFRMREGVAASDVVVAGEARYQVCKNTCRQFKHPFEVTVAGEPAESPAVFASAADAPSPAPTPGLAFAFRMVPTRQVGGEPKADPLSVQFELFPRDAKAGEIVTLAVTMDLEEGWNTYALEPTDDQFQNPTEIEILETENLEPASELTAMPASELEESELGTANIHRGRVTWSRRFTVQNDAPYGLSALMIYQVCDEASRCLPPKDIEFALGSLQTAPPELAEPVVTPVLAAVATPDAADSGPTADAPPAGGERAFRFDEADRPAGLGWNLVLAFLGGLILNIMPCVLPVLAIKVLSFVQQAGESRGRILLLNGTYAVGVMTVFLTLASLAVFLGYGWGQLFQYDGFNLVMACVVFAMGLSLLGVFEIPIPGMIGAAAGGEHREGLTGAFMTGIFATLLATPCSGPFMGTTLAWSVRQPALVVYLVWGMMGLGMASPYLLIGLYPRMVNWLPRPGMWMVRFKEFAGFVLMGTVIFLVNAIDETLIIPALIMMLGIALGLWMVGSLYDQTTPTSRKWSVRVAAFALAAPILWYGWDLYDRAVVEKEMRAASGSDSEQLVVHDDELPWQTFSTERLEELLAAGTPTLVDFTADWCLICKQNEKFALNTEDTIRFVKENGVVTLYADYTDESPEIKRWLDVFQQNGVPLTVIFPAGRPEEPKVLRGPYSQSHLLSMLKDSVQQPAKTAMSPAGSTDR